MGSVPQVPMDENGRSAGQIVLEGGVVIELPIGLRDLVNGGVLVNVGDVQQVSGEKTVGELLDLDDQEKVVWIPGHKLERVVLSSAPRHGRRAGF